MPSLRASIITPFPGTADFATTDRLIQSVGGPDRGRGAERLEGAAQVEGGVDRTTRRSCHSDHLETARNIVLKVADHSPCDPSVSKSAVSAHQPGHHPEQTSEMGVVDEPQESAFEDTTPDPLLRTLHLDDPYSIPQVGVDSINDCSGTHCTAQIAGVLVEETMRDEDHPTTSGVAQSDCAFVLLVVVSR